MLTLPLLGKFNEVDLHLIRSLLPEDDSICFRESIRSEFRASFTRQKGLADG